MSPRRRRNLGLRSGDRAADARSWRCSICWDAALGLRILWELRGGPLQFRPLQERCDEMSSSVLNQRLAEMRAAGILIVTDVGYRLTGEGERLLEAFPPLNEWAERWAARSTQD